MSSLDRIDLARWLLPAIVAGFCLARLIELRLRFRVQPGTVHAPWTLHLLTSIGVLTTVLCLAEYLYRGTAVPLHFPILGIALAVAAFALRHYSRKALAQFWSIHIEVRDGHAVVRHGPYRLIRHPIYVAAIIELLAIPVTLATWRAGAVGLVAYAIALGCRVRQEEKIMHDTVGAPWDDYCRETPAFFPRW